MSTHHEHGVVPCPASGQDTTATELGLDKTAGILAAYWRAEAQTWDTRDQHAVTWVTHGEMLRRCALELETALKGTQP